MSTYAVIAVLGGIAAAGLLHTTVRLLRWRRMQRFAETYLTRFRQLATHEFDEEVYGWLVGHAARIQECLGPLGLMAYDATPYDLEPLSADPLIVNTLPELRTGRVRPERVAQCEEALIRYLARRKEERTRYVKQFINPMVWLGEGVRAALLLPFLALYWLGLFKETFVTRLAQSTAFGLLSGLVAVLGLAASVLIVALGWEPFTDLLAQWVARIPFAKA